MLNQMVQRVAQLRIGDKFHFTGFLKGDEVLELYEMSDVYVMPSVSEPFGISPLEAMQSNVPVIISKQSGVAEVLHHAVKVDFGISMLLPMPFIPLSAIRDFHRILEPTERVR